MKIKELTEQGRRLSWLGWPGGAALSVLVYLAVSAQGTALGFPLDDAWIHQVFARNLAQRGEFSYNPGVPVAGSTSPLWTFLLAPGYFVDGLYSPWTYGLGILFLALTAREVGKLTIRLSGQSRFGLWAGLLTLFEWRMVWAGSSGMETIVFAFGSLWLVNFYLGLGSGVGDRGSGVGGQRSGGGDQGSGGRGREIRDQGSGGRDGSPIYNLQSTIYNPSPNLQSAIYNLQFPLFLLGLAGGLLTLVRPEGMVLLGLIGFDWAGRRWGQWRTLTGGLGLIGLGWAALVLPYFGFNYWLSGSLLPNTFGAKISNYGDGGLDSLLTYFGNGLREIWLAGPLFVLGPGLLFGLSRLRSGLDWRPLVWPVVVFGLYAVRLPVTYQHARYLMPLLPFLIPYGTLGTAWGLDWLRRQKLRRVARLIPWLIALAWGLAWYNNAQAYRADVKFINDEQVRVGRWLAANTPLDATVATHDIGAIEYFGHRRLIDTAGLVSPDFVAIVRDPAAIYARLQKMGVNYFAMLPTWYPQLYEGLKNGPPIVFEPKETYLAQFGQQNMVVYKLR